jgi:rhodanese-related sulfurtransferase
MKVLRDAIIVVIIAGAIAFAVNGARNVAGLKGLHLNTPWPDNRERVELEFPPDKEPGDSILALEDAYNLYLNGDVIFIDTRDPVEYKDGHIKGAINLPFDWWDDYWDEVRPLLDPEKENVSYCDGGDCELSLYSARELKRNGFEKSYVFFGGWQMWIEAGLPVETGDDKNE